jgi:DNA mismatch repair ATPase MutS
MIFFFGFLLFFAIVSFFLYRGKKIRDKRRLQELMDNWGHQKIDDFNFFQISKYFERNPLPSYHRLSEQTLSDIDFHELFVVVDRTMTRIGQQFLFDKLQKPSDTIDELKKLDSTANVFAQDQTLRLKVQEILFALEHKDAYYIESLLGKKLMPRPSWFPYLFISPLLIITLVVISFKNPVAIICLIIPFVVNSIIHFWNKSNTFSFLTSFPQLDSLINVSKKLHSMPEFKSDDVAMSTKALAGFQQKFGFMKFGADNSAGGDLGMIAYYLVELLKAFTLVEVFAFFNLIKELENQQSSVSRLFRFVGEIDTALSVASLRSGKRKTCTPEFTPARKEIIMTDGYHPLIKKCVPNTLHIKNKSILITGSNMSGKTTFLRSIMINALLAQTLYTCFAKSFTVPFLKHYSSIRIQDDVLEGKSLYFQEVSTMRELIESSKENNQSLFILDEVFKGTNTVERIAASKAILSFLNKNDNIVLVATHDLELTKLLDSEYDLYHFTEIIENNELIFDHTIKEGQLKTRNAIRLLQISKFPDEVVNEAKELSDLFLRTSNP